VPAQLSQILSDLEGGKFRVKVQSAELDRIAQNVRWLGLTLFVGLLASGLTVGGMFVLSRDLATWRGLPVLGLAALLVAGALFGGALTFYAVGARMRKISVRRFLRPRR
jgi:ubiquinone biosynthesis protein